MRPWSLHVDLGLEIGQVVPIVDKNSLCPSLVQSCPLGGPPTVQDAHYIRKSDGRTYDDDYPSGRFGACPGHQSEGNDAGGDDEVAHLESLLFEFGVPPPLRLPIDKKGLGVASGLE